MRTALLLAVVAAGAPAEHARATTYFVRQTVGKDTNDGHTPATAWEHVSLLGPILRAGDTAYVGPGLYREQVSLETDGTPEQRITLIADPTGQHTGDPPGVVMLTGAEPVDEAAFTKQDAPGVYATTFLPFEVWGVVEMDGPQTRYLRVVTTSEYLNDHVAPLDVVAKLPSSYHFDPQTHVLTVHTSDGAAPATHELELLRRAAGVYLVGRHYVTVVGFTFRHMQDAGISFFKGTSDGIALGNTSWGSRQGIRVYGAKNILVSGNTLFRNENSGVYFAAESTNGVTIGNVAYENVKGLRWSSQSSYGIASGNVAFDNTERGISIENVDGMILRDNILANNAVSQLLVLQCTYSATDDCFANGNPQQLVADFTPFPFSDRFPTLAAYQAARHQDLNAREGACGALPAKLDVHRLHAETTGYAERARAVLAGTAPAATHRGWLDWLLGR